MSKNVGRVLRALCLSVGGQFIVELPDEMEPRFVADLLEGVNAQDGNEHLRGIAVGDKSSRMAGLTPACDYRELAAYRRGNLLVVVYEGENRGMATYTSTLQPLFAAGFPASPETPSLAGLASLEHFGRSCGALLKEEVQAASASNEMVVAALQISGFLAAAYLAEGNGTRSAQANWLVHIGAWLDECVAAFKTPEEVHGPRLCFGAAGLPCPDVADGRANYRKLTPTLYAETLSRRWSDAEAVMETLSSMEALSTRAQPAALLSKLPWQASFEGALTGSDSLVAVVTQCGCGSQDRRQGWYMLSEEVFLESFLEVAGGLSVWRDYSELPRPWRGGPWILTTGAGEASASSAILSEHLGFCIPWRDGKGPDDAPGLNPDDLNIEAQKGEANFELQTLEPRKEGLLCRGVLTVGDNLVAGQQIDLNALATGGAGGLVLNRCSARMYVARGKDTMIFCAPMVRPRKSEQRGPFVLTVAGEERTAEVSLSRAGEYSFLVVCGEDDILAQRDIRVGTQAPSSLWPNAQGSKHFGACVAQVADVLTATLQGRECIRFHVQQERERPLSPLVAAALGTAPSVDGGVELGVLGDIERELMDALPDGETPHSSALGFMFLSDSDARGGLATVSAGLWVEESLVPNLGNLNPGSPDGQLLDNPKYSALVEAYKRLGLLPALEEHDFELVPSRLSLGAIEQGALDVLLEAYTDLVGVSAQMSASNAFWARYPFSAAVYAHNPGLQGLAALLISPLHPLRLSWLWLLEMAMKSAHEDAGEADALEALRYLDPSVFPAVGYHRDSLGNPICLTSVPIDPSPENVNVGWQALTPTGGLKALVLPRWVWGRRFPVSGLSGLSANAVSSAIDDFVRISPQTQLLRLELHSASPLNRSRVIDQGILDKVASVSLRSAAADGLSGINVIDSENRLGPAPSVAAIAEALEGANKGFRLQWQQGSASPKDKVHVTFMEGSAAALNVGVGESGGLGWVSEVPLRRFPYRTRVGDAVILDYSLAPGNSAFSDAVRAAESDTQGRDLVVQVRPNLYASGTAAEWIVAGDFGADPSSIAEACRNSIDKKHFMLWDWRPVATGHASPRHLGMRMQPYFVLANVPKALTLAVEARIRRLSSGQSDAEVARRVSLVIRTLAEQAIGLNSLLAVGHHQATGALGFFFALRALRQWVSGSGGEEMRLVVPIDAVDPMLRKLAGSGPATQKRADLLAIRVRWAAGRSKFDLCPLEIKHYGLASASSSGPFPATDAPEVQQHLEQLQDYVKLLGFISQRLAGAALVEGHLIAQELGLLLESAIQLSPKQVPSRGWLCIRDLMNGAAEFRVAPGALLWYQTGAAAAGSPPTSCELVTRAEQPPYFMARVDPSACDGGLWDEGKDDCIQAVVDAVEGAFFTMETASLATSAGEAEMVEATKTASDDASGQVTPRELTTPIGGATKPADHPANNLVLSPKRLSQAQLEARYAALLAALGEFGVKVVRPDIAEPVCREGPAIIECAVRPGYGVAVSRIRSQLENLKLRLALPEGQRLGCRTHLGNVLISVPKMEAERYFVSTRELWAKWSRPSSGFSIPLGEDIVGAIVQIDFSDSNSPHLLIAGVTGSGKSEALLTLLLGATEHYSSDELRLRLIDRRFNIEVQRLSAGIIYLLWGFVPVAFARSCV